MPSVRRNELQPEHDEDPETLQDGEHLETKISYCAICFGQIRAPILEGIYYHSARLKKDHQPIPANTLVQLFLDYKNSKGTLLKLSRYDDKDARSCPCYQKWFNLIKKDIEPGFYGDCYYDKEGMTLCKRYLLYITSEPVTDPEFPEKQSYKCEECISRLEKGKIIELVPHKGQSTNPIYNRIKWLKRES